MSEGNRPTVSGAGHASERTVWQHDEAVHRWGSAPPGSHWSQQTTQPLMPRWPAMRRRQAAQRAAVAGGETRALRMGAGCGVLATLAALSLLLLLAIANGWLPGGLPSTSSDATQWPIPASTAPGTPHAQTPISATSVPSSTALPTATAEPTATPQPTATAEPTATAQPTATPRSTATPQPTRAP